jgi:hypothetical protein
VKWWQRILAFAIWPVIFAALCGFMLVAGVVIWIAIPFGSVLTEDTMPEERYRELERGAAELSPDEIEDGWHWCNEFDGLLVGPGMEELKYCHCEEAE